MEANIGSFLGHLAICSEPYLCGKILAVVSLNGKIRGWVADHEIRKYLFIDTNCGNRGKYPPPSIKIPVGRRWMPNANVGPPLFCRHY